mgnify:CR=1 FL=1
MNIITIQNTPIRNMGGLYCLNDLHKAAGGEKRHQPSNWLRVDQTKELINELSSEAVPQNRGTEKNQPVITFQGGDGPQGTFVCKELVYAYAMWISPRFHLRVIRAFDALMQECKTHDGEPFHPALYSEDVRYLQQTVRWLLARLEKYEGPEAIGRRVPVAFLRFEERPMHCINMGQPLLLGIDALALLETESPGYANPRMRLMAAGLNGAEHTVVLRLGDIARALEVPGRMVSRALGAPPQATSMSFITPLGMAALSARLPAFYEWFWRTAVPAVAALPSVRALPRGGAA